MKKIRLLLALLLPLLSIGLSAQAPSAFQYQSIIRDAEGEALMSQAVGLQFIIRKGSESGSAVYTETQNITTNDFGLVNLQIGMGTSSDDFTAIDWASDKHYLEIGLDLNGGSNYTTMGTAQLLSAPYALHANTAKDLSEVPDIVTMAIKDTASQIRTAFPDVSGIASNTQAIKDTASQIRTDFQTVASTVNQAINTNVQAIKDTANQIRNDLPDVSGIASNTQAIKDTANQIRAAITNELPTSGNTGDMAYWDGSQWVAIPAGGEGQVLTFKNGAPAWDGLIEGEVLSATGKIWMDRNLGASQVATSSTDTDAFGDLYQWGRGTDGHEKRTSATTSTLATSDTPGHGDFILNNSYPNDWRTPKNDNLWQGVDGTNNPCPEGYRIPTKAEWEAEIASWSSQNAAGAFDSPLKLPIAGYRSSSNGSITTSSSIYWSSTPNGSLSDRVIYGSSAVSVGNDYRAGGFSVRCIKD